jgi:hypothetical protein
MTLTRITMLALPLILAGVSTASAGLANGPAALALAGVPSDGAAGSIIARLSELNCTLDPAKIKDKAGAGADCSYEAAK